jgi:hypothetical protein
VKDQAADHPLVAVLLSVDIARHQYVVLGFSPGVTVQVPFAPDEMPALDDPVATTVVHELDVQTWNVSVPESPSRSLYVAVRAGVVDSAVEPFAGVTSDGVVGARWYTTARVAFPVACSFSAASTACTR